MSLLDRFQSIEDSFSKKKEKKEKKPERVQKNRPQKKKIQKPKRGREMWKRIYEEQNYWMKNL